MGTENFQMFKLGLEKAEEPDIKLPTTTGSPGNSLVVSLLVMLRLIPAELFKILKDDAGKVLQSVCQ